MGVRRRKEKGELRAAMWVRKTTNELGWPHYKDLRAQTDRSEQVKRTKPCAAIFFSLYEVDLCALLIFFARSAP